MVTNQSSDQPGNDHGQHCCLCCLLYADLIEHLPQILTTLRTLLGLALAGRLELTELRDRVTALQKHGEGAVPVLKVAEFKALTQAILDSATLSKGGIV